MFSSTKLFTIGKKAITGGVVTLLAIASVLVVDEELNSLSNHARRLRRGLSLDLGGGNCSWTEPVRKVSSAIDFHKTLLAGFPSGDKRLVWIQMEALTGLPSKDDWDFVFNGYTNAPFIKTNYPHPSGKWSWGTEADQVALVIQYIRRSMVEFGYIQWYLSYNQDYNKDRVKMEELYGTRDGLDEYYAWRDAHVLREIYKYGWYIDYWMEGGILRDPYTNGLIDLNQWKLYNEPVKIANENDRIIVCHKTESKGNPLMELEVSESIAESHIGHGDYRGTCEEAANDLDWLNGNTQPTVETDPNEDPHCVDISGGCKAMAIISSDKLRDYADGPAETEIIGNIISNNQKMTKYVIARETWPCIWDKVIDKNQGPTTFDDRNTEEDPNFSAFMIAEMHFVVKRLVDKYSASPWTQDVNAARLVSLLTEHLVDLQTEHDLVLSGQRALKRSDFFGPDERRALVAKLHDRAHAAKIEGLEMPFQL